MQFTKHSFLFNYLSLPQTSPDLEKPFFLHSPDLLHFIANKIVDKNFNNEKKQFSYTFIKWSEFND